MAEELTPEQRFAVFKEEGNKSFSKRKFKEAARFYSMAIGEKGDVAVAYVNRAACYLNLDRFHETIEDCNKAIQLDPNNFKSYYRRAHAYWKLSNLKQAKKDFMKVDTMVDKAHIVGPFLREINKKLAEDERLEVQVVEKPMKHRSTKPMQTFKLNNQYSGSKRYKLD